jgi:hypothetical protein
MTTKPQGKPLKAVERDDKGRIKSGSANPGGMTTEARAARDAMNLWLCAEPQIEAGKSAYLELLVGDVDTPPNPVIVKDFMDRVAGKVKEQVELSGDAAGGVFTFDQVMSALAAKGGNDAG